MMWLLGFLPGLLNKGLDFFLKKTDGDVQKALALMEAEKVRLLAQRDVTLAAMGSWVWWTGWALFVFPLGIYHCKILLWDKVLAWGRTDPLDGLVAEWSGYIVLSMFGMQMAKSTIEAITRRWWK
jgi:hypothetical protein